MKNSLNVLLVVALLFLVGFSCVSNKTTRSEKRRHESDPGLLVSPVERVKFAQFIRENMADVPGVFVWTEGEKSETLVLGYTKFSDEIRNKLKMSVLQSKENLKNKGFRKISFRNGDDFTEDFNLND